jgi:hypothetical protein
VVLAEKNDEILAEKNTVAVLQLPFALFYDRGLRIWCEEFREKLLSFRVTSKAFTPCLRVLHEI